MKNKTVLTSTIYKRGANNISRRTFLQASVGSCLLLSMGEAYGYANLPRPNILFIYPDQHRHDWLGANHKDIHTPNIDRLGREGIVFTKCIVPAPVCSPSRACLASGMQYDNCTVKDNDTNLSRKTPNFYRMLKDSGYHTMCCGKIDFEKPRRKRDMDWGVEGKKQILPFGFSNAVEQGGRQDSIWALSDGKRFYGNPTEPYMNYLKQKKVNEDYWYDYRGGGPKSMIGRGGENAYENTAPIPDSIGDDHYFDNFVGRNASALISSAPKGKPWFIQASFLGPHDPMDITASMAASVRDRRKLPVPNLPELDEATFGPEPDESKALEIRQNYTAMVELIDRWVGKLIEVIEARGELDNTLIVYTSDHGDMLGDHHRYSKHLPWQASAGVPLVVRGPGVKKGLVNTNAVTNLDLTATFLDYAGVTVSDSMDSKTLRSVLNGSRKRNRDYVISGLYGWRMVYDGRYKLIRGFDVASPAPWKKASWDKILLYDLQIDPLENRNIAERHPDVVSRMTAILEKETKGTS